MPVSRLVTLTAAPAMTASLPSVMRPVSDACCADASLPHARRNRIRANARHSLCGLITSSRLVEGRLFESRLFESRLLESRLFESRLLESRLLEGYCCGLFLATGAALEFSPVF